MQKLGRDVLVMKMVQKISDVGGCSLPRFFGTMRRKRGLALGTYMESEVQKIGTSSLARLAMSLQGEGITSLGTFHGYVPTLGILLQLRAGTLVASVTYDSLQLTMAGASIQSAFYTEPPHPKYLSKKKHVLALSQGKEL